MARLKDEPKALSVGDFNRRVKDMLEGGLPATWVRGEVSNLRRQASGHVYFTLKDAESQVSCVMFRGDAMKQVHELRDGQSFRVFGQVSVYLPRGTHQLVVRETVPDGLGRLQAAFEALKQKLAGEGLFEPERKQPLPALARRIGFVTSGSGAAWRDFASILRRLGWGGEAILIPAQVQGEGGAASIVAGIESSLRLQLDLLVVGRGGGSLEDLWNFNEEAVVRAIAACPLPTISAVGHEIDVTLSDFAADARAETPSAAAERIAVAQQQLRERHAALAEELAAAVVRQRGALSERLHRGEARFAVQSPKRRLEDAAQRLDDAGTRLIVATRLTLAPLKARMEAAGRAHRQVSPEKRLKELRQGTHELARRMARAGTDRRGRLGERVETLAGRLEQAGLSQALQRGFVAVRDQRNRFVTRRAHLRRGNLLTLAFADGDLVARVTDTTPEVPPPEQSELF